MFSERIFIDEIWTVFLCGEPGGVSDAGYGELPAGAGVDGTGGGLGFRPGMDCGASLRCAVPAQPVHPVRCNGGQDESDKDRDEHLHIAPAPPANRGGECGDGGRAVERQVRPGARGGV